MPGKHVYRRCGTRLGGPMAPFRRHATEERDNGRAFYRGTSSETLLSTLN